VISISSTAMLARDLQRRLARQAAAFAAGGLLAAAPVVGTRAPQGPLGVAGTCAALQLGCQALGRSGTPWCCSRGRDQVTWAPAAAAGCW
jgi:hypothetical protein